MSAAPRTLLPFLLLTLSTSAFAQTSYSSQAQVPPSDPAVTQLQDGGQMLVQQPYVDPYSLGVDQGWTGQLLREAERLRQETIAIEGPAPSRTLRLGDAGDEVQWLIEALIAHGYLGVEHNPEIQVAPTSGYAVGATSWSNNTYGPTPAVGPAPLELPVQAQFNEAIESALLAFQAGNGLKQDGVAGPDVYAALTIDHGALANALDSWAANVAAWANQARAAGHSKMIVVNIPSYTLHAIDLSNNEEVIQSRVIVGRPYTRTPMMMTRVVNLKANPDWTPPKSIKGARYQRPGPNNALGLMRFSTDNNMNIYLHDTNARGLFANEQRALSHGCVRVQQWKPLAAWAAQQDEAWVDDVALVGGKTRFLKVDAVPVVISYSLVDMAEGQARQFDDIYNKGAAAIGHAELQGKIDLDPTVISWTQR